jgi:DNA-binding CsgD family transcriptional regulator
MMVDAIYAALRGKDARRAAAAFDAIAAENGEPQSFVRHALDELALLLGSDLTTLSLCDLERQTRTVISRPGEALSERERATFDRHFREHPLVRFHSTHPHGPTQRITDCLSLRAFRDSAVFAEYYRAIRINHVMALPLRIDDRTVVSVVFNRRAANFADSERALVDILRSPLAALYRGMLARETARLGQASLDRIAAGAGWYRTRVTGEGRLSDLSAESAAMLRHFFRDVPTGGRGEAPEPLRQWLRRRRRNWGLDWLHPDDCAPFVVARGAWKLTVHFVADPLSPENGELVMRRQRAVVAAPDLAGLGLTPREAEVLAILAAGKTNGEIATLLDISPRTVQKHLEHLFQKLGVETRIAAALRAIAAAEGSSDTHRPLRLPDALRA